MSSRTKRYKREVEEDEEEEEEEERMPYFVPEEGIDIEPLALYTRSILDERAKVKLGNHPQRTNEKGFWIISNVPVSREDIAAMIEDTRLWNRESKKGHYVNSDTAKRRMTKGRAPQGRARAAMAQTKAQKDSDDPRSARQSVSRASEQDPRYNMPPSAISRGSADNVTMSERQRSLPISSPSPRPASVQPAQLDPRRPSTTSQYAGAANQGFVQAPSQYNMPVNVSQAQYSQYGASDAAMYDTPPPYSSDVKRGGGSGQPSTTGTQGFQSTYATSGGPPQPRAPNQGQRRHGAG